MKPNIPLIVILSTVALDAVGIGLIMPVLPGLLRDLVHSNDVGSCAAPSAKGDDKFITTDYLQQCR